MSRLTDDITFVQNHQQWPLWPFLTMKRSPEKHSKNHTGVLTAGFHGPNLTIYLVNYFALSDLKKEGKTLKDVEKIEYESVSELLQDGWEVD